MWKSKTFYRIVKSTLAVEAIAVVDAFDVSYFISHVLYEMLFGFNKTKLVNCHTYLSKHLMPIH